MSLSLTRFGMVYKRIGSEAMMTVDPIGTMIAFDIYFERSLWT